MQNGSKLKEAAHFFLNSKGGVGKTHTAIYLTQGYRAAGLPVVALDADATSATFSSFKGLGVRRVNVMEGDKINERIFDNIVEEILTQDTNFVIDTGASAFVELSRYFNRNENSRSHCAGRQTLCCECDYHRRGDLQRNELELKIHRRADAALG